MLYLKELLAEGYVGRVFTAHASLFMPDYRRTPLMAITARRERGSHVLSIQAGHLLDIIYNAWVSSPRFRPRCARSLRSGAWPRLAKPLEVDALTASWCKDIFPAAPGFRRRLPTPNTTEVAGAWKSTVMKGHWSHAAFCGSCPDEPPHGRPERRQELQELPVPERFFHVTRDESSGPGLHVAEVYRNLGWQFGTAPRRIPDSRWLWTATVCWRRSNGRPRRGEGLISSRSDP